MLGCAKAQSLPPAGQPGEDPIGYDIPDVPWRTRERVFCQSVAVGRSGALATQLVAQFGWRLSPVQQISGRGALKGKQGLCGQGVGHACFVLHLKYNRKHSRCLLREVMPGAVFWEDVYDSCGKRDWIPGGS